MTEATATRTNDSDTEARPSEVAARCDCSVCVHGHDLDPRRDSMVVCGPQQKAHPADYCCTGFRRITSAEIDEKTAARFGKPNSSSRAADCGNTNL